MTRLNLNQRIIVVIGWAAALWYVGKLVGVLAGEVGGYVVYAPLSTTKPRVPKGLYLTPLEDFFLWIALIMLWVIGATLVLRTPRSPPEPVRDVTPDPSD